ncbi:MAG TPA: PDZ domain-containing protein [Acidobacteriaceae bacterium]|nr:PDZ domain-containing protein [Acidobacteriaceae bacterium]
MKRFANAGPLITILGCALAVPGAHASGGPLEFFQIFTPHFLLHSSQGYLGVDLRDTREDAKAAEGKHERGAEVVAVDHDAPAAKAGLKVHDVILQMNGEKVENSDQLRRMLRKESAGHTVNFVISREGYSMNLTVQLADRVLLEQQAWSRHFSVESPAGETEAAAQPPATQQNVPRLSGGQSFLGSSSSGGSHFLGTLISGSLYVGADVNPVRTQLADYFGVTSGTGLLVENVDSQSPAARSGLRAGDVILKVNSTAMVSRDDWFKAIRNNRGKLVLVTIMRDKQQQTLTMSAGQPKKGG